MSDKKYYVQEYLDIETKYPKEFLYVSNGTRDMLWLLETIRRNLNSVSSGNTAAADARSFNYSLIKLKHNLFNWSNQEKKYSSYQYFNLNYLYPLYEMVEVEIPKIKKFLSTVANNEILKNIFEKTVEVFQIMKKDKKYENMLIYNIDFAVRGFGTDNHGNYFHPKSLYQNFYLPLDNLNESLRRDESLRINGKTIMPRYEDTDDGAVFKTSGEMLLTDILKLEVEAHVIIKILDQMIKFTSKELNNKSYLTEPRCPYDMDKAMESEIRKSVEDSLIKMKTTSLKLKQKVKNLFRHELIEDKLFNIENYIYSDK